MKTSNHIAFAVFTALVAAMSYNFPPTITMTVTLDVEPMRAASTVHVTSKSQASKAPAPCLPESITVAETGVPRSSPTVTDGVGDYMTIAITNRYGSQLSLSLASNANGPSPIGNPTPAVLPNASPTQYTFPTGWAGRVTVGPNLNPNGSKIEASFTGPPDIDVSYVDGYSVPITCSSEGVAVTGCNINLFEQTHIPCDEQVDGPVCLNSARETPDGPAARFFRSCAGAAYTYPNDNDANTSNLGSKLVSCCIGTLCPAPLRQPSKHPTRSLDRRYGLKGDELRSHHVKVGKPG